MRKRIVTYFLYTLFETFIGLYLNLFFPSISLCIGSSENTMKRKRKLYHKKKKGLRVKNGSSKHGLKKDVTRKFVKNLKESWSAYISQNN